ncbi:MAG: DUF2007 domain-containing protein [Gammaproteobacteria bacterium]
MKTLYEPANALDAYMLQDLLKQVGIEARVDGAYLQGAVGELPANGLVRLRVEDADYEQAREVIRNWETTEVAEPASPAPKSGSAGFRALILGALIGVAGAYLFLRAPLNTEGVDYNHDGKLDVVWRYSPSGTFLGSKVDRNLDGKVDYIETTGSDGNVASVDADDDFDGIFESRHYLYRGNFRTSEVDTDGDTIADLKSTYQHGVLASTEYINPYTGLPLRVEHYRLGVLTAAEVDTDKDGRLDTRYSYSPTAEITATQAIPLP